MCVAAIAWQAHPRWRLVAIGNRDELHARPAAPLADWGDGTIAGRDLEAGGTWLGLSRAGRFALVTNYRVPGYPRPGMASRGALITDWLAQAPAGDPAAMNPFNLFLADGAGLRLVTNHPAAEERALDPGIHGLSNGPFDRPWGKTRRLQEALADWLGAGGRGGDQALLAVLGERAAIADPAIPDAPEAEFSSVMIRHPLYGTRCSTVVLIDAEGQGTITERRFDAEGRATGETRLAFAWPA